MRSGVLAACAWLAVAGRGVARGEPPRYGLRIEAGGEHDTNPARIERIEDQEGEPRRIVPSPAARIVASGDLALVGDRQRLAFTVGGAGKAFARADARPEDVVIAQGSGAYGLSLGRTTSLALGVGYYDVFQRTDDRIEARDFRSIAPSARVDQALRAGRLSLAAGWRVFDYKPEPLFSFRGPTGTLVYRHALLAEPGSGAPDWEAELGATLESRHFSSARCTSAACPGPAAAGRRIDRFWTAGAELTRTAGALLGGGITIHGNVSNSFGESLTRLLVHTRGAFLLPWDWTLSARAELVVTSYAEAVPVARSPVTGRPIVSIEDESRSTLRAELVRALGAGVELGLRYALYTTEMTKGPVDYRRQTLLLYLAFGLER